MSTAPIAFSGISQYSSDLQSILQRAVSIAQLPIQQLQNNESDVLQKQQALTSVQSAVASLATSVGNLAQIAGNKALVASSSDPTLVTATSTGANAATSYTISNIQSIASPASEMSLTGYADSSTSPVSANGNLQLVLGSKTYPITLNASQNNLVGLQNAINNLGIGVTASIITTGTGATPNYLSVSANAPGATTLQVNDVPAVGPATDLLTATNQGSNTVFDLNGVPVSKTTASISDVIPGVTFNVLGKTAGSVAISLGSDRSQLAGAIADFVSKYNDAAAQVNAQIGQSAGPLSGNYIIRQVQDDLHQLTTYRAPGSSSIVGLASLGISLDDTGKMSFDQNAFDSLSDSQLSDAFAFFGSKTTGFGALSTTLTQLSDPVTGLIKVQQDGYTQQSQELSDRISTLNERITTMQNGLQMKLQKADALIATLQSQQNTLTASIDSLDYSVYGKVVSQNSAA